MCIIITRDKNVRLDYDFVENCFYGNPDGAGIMWTENGMVQTAKGFTEPQGLFNAIEAVPECSPLVVHMRIATSGGIDVGTCHPFPITSDLDVLHAASTECHAALAHNGVIHGCPTDDLLGISDTVYFTKEIVARMFKGRVTNRLKKMIRTYAPDNRFAILTKDGTIARIGEGWETVRRGVHASNSSWRIGSLRLCNYGKWYGYENPSTNWYDNAHEEYDNAWAISNEYVVDRYCRGCKNTGSCRAYGCACDDMSDLVDAHIDDLIGDYIAQEERKPIYVYEWPYA